MPIRAASAEDAERLSALAMRSKAHWGYSEAFLAACRPALTYPPETVGAGGFQVLEEAGEIRGFYALVKVSPTAMELDALFVAPEHIGQGHGLTLVEHALAGARAGGAERLVVASDPNAAGFYERAGAVRIGERPSEVAPERALPLYEFRLN